MLWAIRGYSFNCQPRKMTGFLSHNNINEMHVFLATIKFIEGIFRGIRGAWGNVVWQFVGLYNFGEINLVVQILCFHLIAGCSHYFFSKYHKHWLGKTWYEFDFLSVWIDVDCLRNGYVTLLEVPENFWRLSRTAKRFKILSQIFKATSAVT